MAQAGIGVRGRVEGQNWRLGRSEVTDTRDDRDDIVLSNATGVAARFRVADRLRADAAEVVRDWQQFAHVEILSGDHADAVDTVATALRVPGQGRLNPEQKRARIAGMRAAGFASTAGNGKYVHRIDMPGEVVNSNADSVAANVAYWQPSATKFLLKDYKMVVESRQLNSWTVIVSIGFIVRFISILIRSKSRF